MNRRVAVVFAVASLALLAATLAATSRLGREWRLGAFTTDLTGRSAAQKQNIRIAVACLDGTVLPPGGIFSFNRAVGRRALEMGYERAPSMALEGTADAPGGGICQLSSTLYNAGLLAGLGVVERWPHMRTARSVGPGRDATVQYGRWDLRLQNTHPFAVRLRVAAEGERLVAEVMGAAPLEAPVEVRVERISSDGGLLRVQTWRRLGEREERVSQDAYPLERAGGL